jgi:hypothetical protein
MLCGQKAELLNVKAGGIILNHFKASLQKLGLRSFFTMQHLYHHFYPS